MVYQTNDIEEIIITWSYDPHDLWVKPYKKQLDGFQIIFDQGRGTLKLDNEHIVQFETDRTFIEEIHKKVEILFKSASAITSKSYNLRKYSVEKKLKGNGSVKEISAVIDAAVITEDIHLQIISQDGNVVGDSKSDIDTSINDLSELYIKHYESDLTAKHIIDYYNESVHTPDRILTALFDLYEVLSERFGNKHDIRDSLGVSINNITRFKRIVNDLPLKQGRHSGGKIKILRDATNEEISEARDIAKALLLNYLLFLDKNS